MRKSLQERSSRKKIIFITLLLGVILGVILFAGTATIMHKTSDTEFCVSCHTMQQPLAEYQGSVHFQNDKGIRAECSDCHVPHQSIDYMLTKIGALKDVWSEMTGKIDTPEKYESHKLEMAQTVWHDLKQSHSATCRSCHNYNAMDVLSQTPEARKQHPVAIKQGETCIDCHKGVAHILPNMSGLAAAGANELASEAAKTSATTTTLYTIQTQPFWLNEKASDHNDGNLMASTEVSVVKRDGGKVLADVKGWQQDGITEAFYAARGKRIMTALLGEEARKALKVNSTVTDPETKQIWHEVELQVWLPAKGLIGDQQKIWRYAADLMANNCTGCHGLTELNRFNANQWIGVVKGMSGRTSLTQEQVRLLTQYVQKHASDMPAANQDQK